MPKVYTQLSTQKVLTLEWIDGARLTDLPALQKMGLEPTKMVDALVQCSLRQMLENGFFHADPHAGNLLAMSNGKLCYLDFGMVSYVESSQRYSIIEAVVHMVNRDFVALTELYRRMGFIPQDVDTKPIIQALEKALPDVLNAPVGDFNFKNVISKLGDVMYKFPFSLPPFYIAIIRCLGVLEGLAIQIDSNFRIISDAYPYIASKLLTDPSPELQAALQQLLFTEQGKLRWDRLEELLEKAMTIPDYDVAMAIDHAIKYLVLPQASAMRIQLAEELVNGFDQLESEAVDLLLQYAASGEITLTTLRKVISLRGDGKGLDDLLDRFLALQQARSSAASSDEKEKKSKSSSPDSSVKQQSSLFSLARALRILRSSGPSTASKILADGIKTVTNSGGSNITVMLRKMLREPVLQEWMIQIIGDISERISMKMIRRVFRRTDSGTSNEDIRRRIQKREKRLRQSMMRSNGLGKGRGELGSTAVSLMTMAFFSGLDVLLKQSPETMGMITDRFNDFRESDDGVDEDDEEDSEDAQAEEEGKAEQKKPKIISDGFWSEITAEDEGF